MQMQTVAPEKLLASNNAANVTIGYGWAKLRMRTAGAQLCMGAASSLSASTNTILSSELKTMVRLW